jgi:outer membrane protein OmpA-like peptidoglycan-associated protein/osmotically-inducible protein OsmY
MRDWCRWCRPSLFVPLLALLALAGMAGGCGTVQSDVRERSIAELEAAGLAAVTVDDVTYRNVTLSGPDELEDGAVELVRSLEATREVSYVGTGGSATTEPDPTAVVTDGATIEVTASIAEGSVTLRGNVPDETTRDDLVAAASSAYGAENVVDQLTVAGSEISPDLSAAAADLAAVIAGFPDRFVTGEARLDGTSLTVAGTAANAAAAEELVAQVAGLTGVDGTTELDTVPDAATAPLDVTADIASGSITLSGSVPDEGIRTSVVDAAVTGFGADNVTDDLSVSGTEPTAELTGAAADLATVLSGPAPGLAEGVVALDGTALTVTGTAADPEGVGTINDALAGLTSVTTTATVGADPGQAVDALGELLTLAPITFESGSDVITAESEETLLTAVEYLTAAFAADPDLAVEIGGHTDDQGDEGFNLDLSQARASAVLQFLTDNGVPATGLTATGYGEAEPVADNATSEGRAQNRRIEFTIVEG